MRPHDLRMGLAAIVAFGPVVFAAVYGVANASRLQAASVPTIAAAPVEDRALGVAPPLSLSRNGVISARLETAQSQQ
jgi:hypothetical protein